MSKINSLALSNSILNAKEWASKRQENELPKRWWYSLMASCLCAECWLAFGIVKFRNIVSTRASFMRDCLFKWKLELKIWERKSFPQARDYPYKNSETLILQNILFPQFEKLKRLTLIDSLMLISHRMPSFALKNEITVPFIFCPSFGPDFPVPSACVSLETGCLYGKGKSMAITTYQIRFAVLRPASTQ